MISNPVPGLKTLLPEGAQVTQVGGAGISGTGGEKRATSGRRFLDAASHAAPSGAASVAADAEICAMLADTLEEVGIPRGDYVVRVNNRKVLNGVLEAMGLGDDQDKRDAVLRTIDKFDKVGEAGVRELLGKGRLDASGAYIDGVGLSDEQAEPVVAFLTSKGADNAATLTALSAGSSMSRRWARLSRTSP